MIHWLTIIGMGVITYAVRVSPFLLLERLQLRPTLLQALRFVPTAVLSAIILPEMLMPDGVLALSLSNARLLAGLGAMMVAWYSRNVLWTIGVGMGLLWLLSALLA